MDPTFPTSMTNSVLILLKSASDNGGMRIESIVVLSFIKFCPQLSVRTFNNYFSF